MTNPNENLARLREKQDLERHIDELRQKRREISGELRKSPRDTKLLSERERIAGELRNARQEYSEIYGTGAQASASSDCQGLSQTNRINEVCQPVSGKENPEDVGLNELLQFWIEEFQIQSPNEEYPYDSAAYWRSLTGYGREFEMRIGTLFRDLGYDVKVTRLSGDEGIDTRLDKDDEITLLQCKAQNRPVTRGALEEFLRDGEPKMPDRLAFASTSGFTEPAETFAEICQIELYDHMRLADLGAEAKLSRWYSFGNLIIETSSALRCPKCGGAMQRRIPHHDVQPFWGCTDYPQCEGIREIATHS